MPPDQNLQAIMNRAGYLKREGHIDEQLGDDGAPHIDWTADSLPSLALSGEPLPPGHPVTDASRMTVIPYGHTDGASSGWQFGTITPA
ncbi:hypothetical protein [Nonomuraea sp. NPDC049158]|uniref:hypothetical protein n=1 Tax=Nonomuraea sp. NPDC049158 TaxID=3155649 RepID=UPI0033EA6FF7